MTVSKRSTWAGPPLQLMPITSTSSLARPDGQIVRRVAQQGAVVAGKGGLGDDGDVGGEGAGGGYGRFQFLQIRHRFQNNQIYAALNQRPNLLAEMPLPPRPPSRGPTGPAARPTAPPNRPAALA